MNFQERVLRLLHQVLLTPVAMVVSYCEEVCRTAISRGFGHMHWLGLSSLASCPELIRCTTVPVDGWVEAVGDLLEDARLTLLLSKGKHGLDLKSTIVVVWWVVRIAKFLLLRTSLWRCSIAYAWVFAYTSLYWSIHQSFFDFWQLFQFWILCILNATFISWPFILLFQFCSFLLASSYVPIVVDFFKDLILLSFSQAFNLAMVEAAESRHSQHGLCLLTHIHPLINFVLVHLDYPLWYFYL